MSEPHDEHQHGPVFDTLKAEGRLNWIFFDFWPIMIFVAAFALMCSIPIVLSGMLHNPFSAADVVWWGYGLLLLGMFMGALALFIVAPRFTGVYTLLVSIYFLVMAEHFHAWTVGGTPWGNSIAILFLTYALIANLIFMRADQQPRRR